MLSQRISFCQGNKNVTNFVSIMQGTLYRNLDLKPPKQSAEIQTSIFRVNSHKAQNASSIGFWLESEEEKQTQGWSTIFKIVQGHLRYVKILG